MKEIGYTETITGLRVSNSFYRKTGQTALEGKFRADIGTLGIPELTGKALEAMPVFDDKATLFTGAELAGIWHYSSTRVIWKRP
jgi:hypothetical protein